MLSDLRDPDEVLSAVRASCAVPLLSGAPQQFRGEPLVDGGFLESLPYCSALREGATHVLVLRSRPVGYRLGPYPRLKELAMRLAGPEFVSMLRARPQRYNREAEGLERLASHPPGSAVGHPGHSPAKRRLAERLEREVKQIQECIRLVADASAALVLGRGTEQLEAAA